jgi:heme-degrading monooxygenase HmoA
MKKVLSIILTMLVSLSVLGQQGIKSAYFEMRTYTTNEGKRPDLIKRFQDHTLRLFEKNGIENVAYFIPADEADQSLTFILGYPSEASRDELWNKFANDPEWKAAHKASEANGPLVQKVDQVFMVWAPGLNNSPKPSASGIFQLRTYYCLPGRIENIQARFRNHTQALFAKQGLKNYPYWLTVEKDGSQPKLVYLIGHTDKPTFEASFQQFVKDPEWLKARDASEESGKIVEKVDAKFLKSLPFSPMK